MRTQGSDAGTPLIRHTTEPWNCWGVTTEKPAPLRACMADPGSPPAHRVLVDDPVSTTTVTPDVPEHAAALAGVATSTRPANARPDAATAPASRRREAGAQTRIRRALRDDGT